ncbi:hypothetical protein MMC2321_02528 [Chitinophaga sp. MM2321]
MALYHNYNSITMEDVLKGGLILLSRHNIVQGLFIITKYFHHYILSD